MPLPAESLRTVRPHRRTVAGSAALFAVAGLLAAGFATVGHADDQDVTLPGPPSASVTADQEGYRPHCARGSFRAAKGDRLVVRLRQLRESTPRFRASFAGARVCNEPKRIVVFRVPDPAFDRAVRMLDVEGLRVRIIDAPVSRTALSKISRKAFDRAEQLQRNGADWVSGSYMPEGYLFIGVTGDLDAARRVLKDLDRLPYVEVVSRPPVEHL
jgi:hypothetical protein